MRKLFTRLAASTMLFFLLIGTANLYGQNQIIGSFPNTQGGLENQTASAVPNALSTTTWNAKASGSTIGTITSSASARTGSKYLTMATGLAVSKYLACPTALSLAASTAYTIQFYYKTADNVTTAASYCFGSSPTSGGTFSPSSTPIAFTGTTGIWTKQTVSFTTASTAPDPTGWIGVKTVTNATTKAVDFDDVVVYAGATDVIAPDAPTAPSAITSLATQMSVSWTAPGTGVDGGGYMVVRGLADPATTPNPNGIYAIGNNVAVGEQVVYIGTTPSFTDNSLTPSTTYYYRIYTVDKAFNYSTAASATGTTNAPNYAVEPTTQASAVTLGNVTSTSFDINWTAGNGTNSLVVVRSGSAVNSDPLDGNTYTPNTVFGSGSPIGTGNYVVYNGTGNTVSLTGLSRAITYYVKVYSFNGTGGTENYLITSPASGSQLTTPGEISSKGTNSAGALWSATGTWVNGVVPGPGDNVTIVNGDKIQVAGSASCFNLTVQAGAKLYNDTPMPSSSLQYVTVSGSSITCDGILGDKTESALTKDGGLGINFVGNLTINGVGTIRPCRIRPNAATTNATLTINANMEMTYPGSNGGGGSSIYTDNSTNDNITVTVNPGKTLSFVDYSNLTITSSSSSNGNVNTIFNINGTVTMPGIHSYISIPSGTGKTAVLNVNGTLNAANLNATSLTGGTVPTITVGNTGSIVVTGLADFGSSTLSANVTGGGAFTLNSGGSMNIGAASGLEPVAGSIRTATRNFNAGANYNFTGTVAQLTGSDLPSTVNAMTINNASGVSLGNPTTLTSGLTLTAGALNNSTNNITLGNGATIILTAGSIAAAPIFGTSVNLNYNGTAAQTTALEVPATSGVLNLLTVNNVAGVSLSSPTALTGGLTLTSGALNNSTNNITLGNGATIILTAGSIAAAPIFSTSVNLNYNGTAAQTTGFEVPSTSGVLNLLTVNNAAGLTLGSNATVNGILALTAGKLSLGANNLTVATTGSITGASATNYFVTNGAGTLTQSIGAGLPVVFPVGASITSYDPATLTPTSATDAAVNVGTTLPASAPSNYTYNAKVWTVTPTVPSSTVVTLTPSVAAATSVTDVIGQYITANYVNTPATKSGNAYTGTFSAFSPFVTGTSDIGTGISQTTIKGVSFDGKTIHNDANVELKVFDTTGRLLESSTKNITMSSSAKGIYIVKSTSGTLKIVL